jgi:hypothetical protein
MNYLGSHCDFGNKADPEQFLGRGVSVNGHFYRRINSMKIFPSLVVAGLLVVPALGGSATAASNDSLIQLTGAHACIGPACVGTDRDEHWRHRHEGYGYDRRCREITIRDRRPGGDVVVRHERRCD